MAGPAAPAWGQAEIDSLFGDAAFRELIGRGSPALVVSAADASIVWANGAARRAFGDKLGSLAARLIAGSPPSSGPRLKRLLWESADGVVPLSFLAKAAALSGGAVFAIALLGASPAPAHEPSREEEHEQREAPAEAPAPAAPLVDESAPTAQIGVRTAQEVRADLLRQHRNPTIRFLWQTDQAGRITSLTPPLGEIVGRENANFVGEEIGSVVARLHLDPSGRLMSAMSAPETWSGIEVAWPIAGAAAAVPVDLGGFPVFDAGRVFQGFRGFGVIHLDRIREAEAPSAPTEAIATAEGHAAPESPAEADGREEPTPVASSPEPEPVASDGVQLEQPAPVLAPNVVPLRPLAALAAAFGLRPPAPPSSARTEGNLQDQPEKPALSESEHDAFDEIGRKLSEAAGEPGPTPVSQPPAVPAGGAAIPVLDRLSLGVLVSRGETAVYANRMLLDIAGYGSLDELRAAGGLTQLFEAPAQTENGAATASIRTRQGQIVSVESKLQAIAWGGEPASLLTLRRASDGAHFAQARSLELELQHRESEARELRAILDTATDGIAILDADGRILSLNHSAEALFGYQQNEVAGEAFTLLIAPESRRLVEDYLGKLKAGGVPSIFNGGREVFGIARQGGTIPIFVTLGRVGGDVGESKLCAVFRDTSAWKRAEQEAREAREEAERASAIKSDFLAKVSHEIRTPLNAIIGFAEVIMDERLGPIGTERYKDYLRDIHKSGTHVMSLVNDLLDLSKIEAGKMVLDIKTVDANAVVSECVALMQPQANRERVIMRLALAPRLAPIAADERSLRQIVLNLLSNAVKYNEPGGQVIISTATNDAGYAVIRIKDTGIGMSESELALALEPFRQVATARPVSGTGLGLPLTKALVEANRANFTIRSRKNEGTLVELSFPPARVLAESA